MPASGRQVPSEWPGDRYRFHLLVILATAVIGLALIRLATGGWEVMGADHARYVYGGMSLLDGRGYVNETGDTYLLRAPAYPVMVGAAYAIAGVDGAHFVALALGTVSLLLAIAIAARLGGSTAAVATTLAVVGVAQFWEQLVSIGIDLPQAAFYLAALLLLWEPTIIRWLAAGALLGIALLIKETIAPAVVLLPIAWLPVWSELAWSRWARLTLAFLLAVAVVAGWWWLVVWQETGLLFPLNSIQAIVPDEDSAGLRLTPPIVIAGLAAAAAWAFLLITRFRDPGVRLIAVATLALAPAVAATVALAQPARNLSALVLLSCVAVGIAVADAWKAVSPRATRPLGRVVVAAVAVAIVVGAAIGQTVSRTGVPGPAAGRDGRRAAPRAWAWPGDHLDLPLPIRTRRGAFRRGCLRPAATRPRGRAGRRPVAIPLAWRTARDALRADTQ